MIIELKDLAERINPDKTVLLFGAGSSIPSGAPDTKKIIDHFVGKYSLPDDGYGLSEISYLAEQKSSRHSIITELRTLFKNLKPKKGLLELPRFGWKSIYSTNYDTLVEDAYNANNKTCRVYASNFDFGFDQKPTDCELFKLHGTIEKDGCDGYNAKLILTDADYDETEAYRQQLYDRFRGDLAGADLLIIGQSLADKHLSELVKRAISLNDGNLQPAKISLLLYTPDTVRAQLYERYGLQVAFGGIDDLLENLELPSSAPPTLIEFDDPVFKFVSLGNSFIDVINVSNPIEADVSAMFNGWPARHPEIEAGLTFERDISTELMEYFEGENVLSSIILGAAGVGKSTAARQTLQKLRKAGYRCFEHVGDEKLVAEEWIKVAGNLRSNELVGALFIDEAHLHLHEINDLVDGLAANDNAHLKILVVSTNNHWRPRNKSENLYKFGKEFKLSKLSPVEIDRLLTLIERQPKIKELVEDSFSGFSKPERKRRLVGRCEADMFVCLKNIFATEAYNDIILREYASLERDEQKIYRLVAALQTSGIRVHRQLVVRLLRIEAQTIRDQLLHLDEIIQEYSVDEKTGVYGWRCRHEVISEIIRDYKFSKAEDLIKLFEQVIETISPTYNIEILSIRQLCNAQKGIACLPDKNEQNRLLRMIISNIPNERVPRHRLMRNLIDQGDYEKAETEIRVFKNDFGDDGPTHRYRIKLKIERSRNTRGILEEDRVAILDEAHQLAVVGAERYPTNRAILSIYAELGIEIYRKTRSYAVFDEAIKKLKTAFATLGDPEFQTAIKKYERRIVGHLQ